MTVRVQETSSSERSSSGGTQTGLSRCVCLRLPMLVRLFLGSAGAVTYRFNHF